ncbi:hypothetical protein [Streptomyces tauricus]|uniref:hypothetical protein n=1 Tax=Streptomyces tauricus TaxID=68274 RepID=UPI00224330E8|nr:hypothetical protein [Streptomyces tauricus]MCW8103233.1 hypothetical protein [Streptomyces tauricus]
MFESANFGTDVVLAAKLPYEQIDHLLDGADAYLTVNFVETRRGSYLWSAFTVADHDTSMFYLQRTHRYDELQTVLRFIRSDDVTVALFDELNRCVGSLRGELDGGQTLAESLASWDGDLARNDTDGIENTLEAQADEIDRHPKLLEKSKFCFSKRKTVEHFNRAAVPSPTFDADRMLAGLRFDERDVGVALETNITRLMSSVFQPDCLFPSPSIGVGSHARELIDVVAVADGSLIFVEAKAVQTSLRTDLVRRESNGQKSLTKAVKQLQGATRRARQARTLRMANSHLSREIVVEGKISLIAIVGEFAASSMAAKPGLNHASHALDVLCVLQLSDLYAILAASSDPAEFLNCLDEVGRRQDQHGYEQIMRPDSGWSTRRRGNR